MEPRLPIRVVVADDHHIWRSGLKADLGEGFEVVGEAEDASSAIEMIDLHTPDLALIDLHMPDGGGLRVVRERATSTAIVIITVSEAERDLLDAVAAGAVGYMSSRLVPRICEPPSALPLPVNRSSLPNSRLWCSRSSGAWPGPALLP